MENIVERFLKCDSLGQEILYYNEVVKKNRTKDFHNAIIKYLKRKARLNKSYLYLVTFTLKPEIDESEYGHIENYIKKQFTNRAATLHIKKASIVKEYTKKGKPHWHVALETSKFLKKDRFNYYKTKYGFIDISKSRHKCFDEIVNYISKCDIPTQLVHCITTSNLTK